MLCSLFITSSHQAKCIPLPYLTGHRVGLAQLSAPEAPSHGHDGQLGHDDGAADGGGHLHNLVEEMYRLNHAKLIVRHVFQAFSGQLPHVRGQR